MSNLSPCPICGESKGYTLSDGTTFRWWSVRCAACGTEVAECRADRATRIDEPKPATWPWADEEWNNAGAHAQGLRTRLAAAEKLAKAAKAITRRHYETFGGCVDNGQLPIGEVWALREALDEWEKLQ